MKAKRVFVWILSLALLLAGLQKGGKAYAGESLLDIWDENRSPDNAYAYLYPEIDWRFGEYDITLNGVPVGELGKRYMDIAGYGYTTEGFLFSVGGSGYCMSEDCIMCDFLTAWKYYNDYTMMLVESELYSWSEWQAEDGYLAECFLEVYRFDFQDNEGQVQMHKQFLLLLQAESEGGESADCIEIDSDTTMYSFVNDQGAPCGAVELDANRIGDFYLLYEYFLPSSGNDFALSPYSDSYSVGDYLFSAGYLECKIAHVSKYAYMYSEANSDSEIIAYIPLDEKVQMCGEYNYWKLCRYGSRYGWLDRDAVSLVDRNYNYSFDSYDYGKPYIPKETRAPSDTYPHIIIDTSRSVAVTDTVYAFASSWLTEQDSKNTYYHKPENAVDGSKKTAWVENAKGSGVGEWIELWYEDSTNIGGFLIQNGYQASQSIYDKNIRPRSLGIYIDDEYIGSVELQDSIGSQAISLGKTYYTATIRLEIESVYTKNAKYEDACISEIRMLR